MKKLFLILILLFTTKAIFAPGVERDPGEVIENYLCNYAELNRENLDLAFRINRITAPEIVMAQGHLETGNFQSKLCIGHNNLFGMKLARIRSTTALGATDNDYASYRSWYDSVKDMKLFQEWYLSRGRDLTDYYGFLSAIGYAEDPLYIPKVKELCIALR